MTLCLGGRDKLLVRMAGLQGLRPASRKQTELSISRPSAAQKEKPHDTVGAGQGKAEWREGCPAGCPSSGTETGPWTRLAAPRAWQKPHEPQGSTPLSEAASPLPGEDWS